ncbi:TetR/AcrR family transcriptional regulator [Paraburkholderia sp. MM6662-R1]
MGRSSRKQAEVTREEILDAAEVLFARDGVSAVPLTSIARHAGLTTGAVYWHFADKDELLVALFDRVHLPVSVLIPDWPTWATTGHGAERILAFCLRLVDRFLDSPAGLRRASIFLTRIELSERNVLTERIRSATRELRDALRNVIELATCARDVHGSLASEQAARLLFAILVGSVKLSLIEGEFESASSAAKSCVIAAVSAFFHSGQDENGTTIWNCTAFTSPGHGPGSNGRGAQTANGPVRTC